MSSARWALPFKRVVVNDLGLALHVWCIAERIELCLLICEFTFFFCDPVNDLIQIGEDILFRMILFEIRSQRRTRKRKSEKLLKWNSSRLMLRPATENKNVTVGV